jgi:hypothetical protein
MARLGCSPPGLPRRRLHEILKEAIRVPTLSPTLRYAVLEPGRPLACSACACHKASTHARRFSRGPPASKQAGSNNYAALRIASAHGTALPALPALSGSPRGSQVVPSLPLPAIFGRSWLCETENERPSGQGHLGYVRTRDTSCQEFRCRSGPAPEHQAIRDSSRLRPRRLVRSVRSSRDTRSDGHQRRWSGRRGTLFQAH